MNVSLVPSDDCRRARAAMSARLDGELSRLGEERLAAHVRACPACSAYALEVAAIATRMRQARLERPERPIAVPRRASIGAFAAAAVAVAAAATIAVGTIGHAANQGTTLQADSEIAVQHIQTEHRLVATLSSLNVPASQGQGGRLFPI